MSRGMKRGFALITVLAVLVVIVFGATAILTSVAGHINIKSRTLQELQNQYFAEAGMQWAIWDCRNDITHCNIPSRPTTIDGQAVNIATTEIPAGSGNYKFVVTVNYASA